jgi:hypothetical protein
MAPAPSPPASFRGSLPLVTWLVAAWIALGTALRIGLALGLGAAVAPAEAEGFVRAWTELAAHDASRIHPAGWLHLLELLGRLTGPGQLTALRLGAVLLSLLALACALRLVLRLLESPERRPLRPKACAWLAGLWALWPALIDASVRPVQGTASSACACLLVAALLGWRARPTVARWLELVLMLLLACLVGGLALAGAALVALLIFVLPLPRPSLVAPLLGALLVAGGATHALDHDEHGAWRPEGSAALSALQLVHVRHDEPSMRAVHPDRRAAAVLANAAQSLAAKAASVPGALARRLGRDLLGPGHWPLAAGLGGALAALDGSFLGVALAGVAVLLWRRRRTPSAGWPCAALAAGLLALLLLLLLTAIDPWALAPLELLAAAGAAVVLAEGGARRVLLAAGVLLAGFAVLCGPSADSAWDWMTPRDPGQGPATVELLRAGAATELTAQLELMALLTDPAAPLLRLPAEAMLHADEALRLAPDDARVLLAVARVRAEALDFEGAKSLAGTILGPDGRPVPEARTTLTVIADMERRLRSEHLP